MYTAVNRAVYGKLVSRLYCIESCPRQRDNKSQMIEADLWDVLQNAISTTVQSRKAEIVSVYSDDKYNGF